MPVKRGLSLDEKRQRLLECFHSSADVFVFKDVEKMAVQQGITPQSVKEVVQSLVDDDLVHQEKIGASNYFWAFPSEATVKVESEVADLTQRIASLKVQRTAVEEAIEQEKKGREASEVRTSMLSHMQNIQENLRKLESERQKYADNDPKRFSAIKEAREVAKEAANRWLDNLHALHNWCRSQLEGREDDVEAFFKENGLSEDLTYL
ncbi:unnamed protein product [Ostreobium quekettii]|uniref:Meiotic nuclear division protein 1 homolog n=1 Tax=Ostreobium quekettii TaxID=121088 RepID=A0A8S1IQV8_9CHLO|nr:unnamed protein product [Ostreobium quekettii]|eukprot:evm.model.scf_582.4 EVM.evm.TU.scf_582.4   scf_582:15588-18410(+)